MYLVGYENTNGQDIGVTPVTPLPVTNSSMSFTSDRELIITETEREKNVRASYVLSGIQATTWAVLVDLSNIVTWPHKATGRIDISAISMQLDKSSNSVGLMQLGVVTRVDATNGDVTTFGAIRFENSTENFIVRDVNLAPSQIKCDVVAGVTPHIISNSKILNDTGIQSDVAIPSASGSNVIPAVGDIVIKYTHTSGGVWTGGMGILYHGET